MINIPLSKQYRTIAGHVSIWKDAIFYCTSVASTIWRSQVTSKVRGQITVQWQIDNSKHPKCPLAKINYTLQNRGLALRGN